MLATAFVLGVVFYFNLDNENMVNVLLYYGYALFALAVFSAVVLPLFNIGSNPKALKKIFTNLAIVIVVCCLSYVLASGDALTVSIKLTSDLLLYSFFVKIPLGCLPVTTYQKTAAS